MRWLVRLEAAGAPRLMPLIEELVALRPNSLEVLTQAAYRSVSVGELDAARSYLARARPLLDLPVAGHAGNMPAANALILMFEDAWSRDDIPSTSPAKIGRR
jgi:hypothetical protein